MQKRSTALLAILVLSSVLLFNFSSFDEGTNAEKEAFAMWREQFQKKYPSKFEENYRFNLFTKNYRNVLSHNAKYEAGEELYFLRLNILSDLTPEQISSRYFAVPSEEIPSNFACTGKQYVNKTSFDANFTLDAKIVNPAVYDQLNSTCASGYAFATTAAVESLIAKIFNNIIPLSAQQLVDCSKQTQNNGCTSGNSLNTLHYLINRGAMKNIDYPYVGKTGDCKYTAAKKIFEVQSCVKVDADMTVLKSQIFNQPVIVSFDATGKNFASYGGGLYQPESTCGSKINHYMLAIGWGEVTKGVLLDKKTYRYIKVKNSLGAKWGQNGIGYIVMEIDKKTTSGCGLFKQMYFPYA